MGSATCCDDDGCVASTSKCCCCLAHGEVPPSNTPGVGCGPAMLCAKWNEDSTNPYEQEEMSLLKSTCWCFSAYCCMFGCNSPGGSDPCCKQEGKLCCLWTNLETDTCCGVTDASYPAGRTPGFVCCNYTMCCRNLPETTLSAEQEACAVVCFRESPTPTSALTR